MTDAVDAFTLTPEQATAKLADMGSTYRATQAVDPRAQLEQKYADEKFRGRLDGGSPEARAEFDRMVTESAAANPVKAAMGGLLPEGADGNLRLMADVADHLRELGISERSIEQALSGEQEPKEAFGWVKSLKSQRLGDPDWVKRYLAGGAKEKQEMTLMSIVLSAGPKEAA